MQISSAEVRADRLDGGDATDWADYRGASTADTANLTNGLGTGGEAAGDRYISIENLLGSNFDDRLIGNADGNILRGGTGADTLEGGGGAMADYFGASAGVVLNSASGGTAGEAAGDNFSSIENVRGSSFDDWIIGDGHNTLCEDLATTQMAAAAETISFSRAPSMEPPTSIRLSASQPPRIPFDWIAQSVPR